MNWMPNDFMQGSGFGNPFGQMPMMPQQGFPPMGMPPQMPPGGMAPQIPPMAMGGTQPPMPPMQPPMPPAGGAPFQMPPQQMPQMPPMPMKELGGLLKAAGDRPGYLNPVSGKKVKGSGNVMNPYAMAVRG